MGIEIERRFLVSGEEWRNLSVNMEDFQQGYLSNNFKEWIIRIRIINQQRSELTIKKLLPSKFSNQEFEYSIPLKDAQSLWNQISNKVHKKRYFLKYGPGRWTVDCFQGKNYPLVIAEVELSSEQELIKKPDWCNLEISGVKELSNAYLSQHPITNWTQQELKNFNLI